MEVMTSLSDLYIQIKALDKGKNIVVEMKKMEAEFYIACEAAREYLDSRKDDSSSVSSDILSVELQRMNIPDRSETYRKEESLPLQQGTLPEVGTFGTNNYNVEYVPRLNERTSPCCNTMTRETGFSARCMYTNSPIERKTNKRAHWTDIGQGMNFQHV